MCQCGPSAVTGWQAATTLPCQQSDHIRWTPDGPASNCLRGLARLPTKAGEAACQRTWTTSASPPHPPPADAARRPVGDCSDCSPCWRSSCSCLRARLPTAAPLCCGNPPAQARRPPLPQRRGTERQSPTRRRIPLQLILPRRQASRRRTRANLRPRQPSRRRASRLLRPRSRRRRSLRPLQANRRRLRPIPLRLRTRFRHPILPRAILHRPIPRRETAELRQGRRRRSGRSPPTKPPRRRS